MKKKYYNLIFWINVLTDRILDKKRIKELENEIKDLEYYLGVEGKTYTFAESKIMNVRLNVKRRELENLKIISGLNR